MATGETDKSTIIAGDFSPPLSEMDRSIRQKVSENIVELDSTINQLDVIDIYTLLHPTTIECTFFSSSHETCIKTDRILVIKHTLTNLKE